MALSQDSKMERMGVVRDEKTGELFIPASRRPDGSWRKPRKVKEGYVPPEEVPVYETRGMQFVKSRSNLPPGLVFKTTEEAPAVGTSGDCATAGMSKAAKKNAKRREKKKQIKEGDEMEEVAKSLADSLAMVEQQNASKAGKGSAESAALDEQKRFRALRKKLKAIDELQAKVDRGELVPNDEQHQKLARREALLKEMEECKYQPGD